jgi:hypothetical protein
MQISHLTPDEAKEHYIEIINSIFREITGKHEKINFLLSSILLVF